MPASRSPATPGLALAVAAALAVVLLGAWWLARGPDLGPLAGRTTEAAADAEVPSAKLRDALGPDRAPEPGALERVALEEDMARVKTRDAERARAASPHLRVLVTDQEGTPLPAARVRVNHDPRWGGVVLAEGVTGESGHVTTELPDVADLHAFELTGMRLSVTGWAPTRQELTRRIPVLRAYGDGGGRDVTLALSPGGTLHGIVVDRDGEPVAGARVSLSGAGEEPHDSERVLARTNSRVDGSYTLGWPEEARTFSLSASHGSHGQSGATQLLLPAWGAHEPPALVLRPRSRLEGTVRFPDGSPGRAVPVTARWVSDLAGAETGASRTSGPTIHADAAGRFSFGLLPPGVYQLETKSEDDARARYEPDPAHRHATDARGIELQARCAVLAVTVRDVHGRALNGVSVSCVLAERESDGALRLRRNISTVTGGDPPIGHLALRPGSLVVLRVNIRACHPASLLVQVPTTPEARPVEVVVHARASFGTLAPTVLGPDGRARSDYRIHAYDPISRRRSSGSYRVPPDEPPQAFRFDLPPGRWLLHAVALDEEGGGGYLAPGLGVEVEVEAGETVPLELTLR